jgi:superfamily II DNA or RNA helicase
LVELLEYVGIVYEVEDRRNVLKEINVEYNAILRETQRNAVDTLLKYDNGLLIAPTGSGKTIMGMEVISRLKKPTLILVEKVKLIEQWKERINQFLKIYCNKEVIEPGSYYGPKKKLTGIIDVASIKSIKDQDDFYVKYEIIIGDEIHHMASKTYEEIIRKIQAKHIYGFTATPKRSDNLEKIIYKIISPIRATLEETNGTFEKVLKPRFTKFKNKDRYDFMNYADLLNELYKDSNRNQQRVGDIVEEYKKNKCILVLTERIEHISILKDLLSHDCDNIYTISGSDGAKARRQFNESIHSLENKYISISTGSFLGEGFDLGSLNTFFITKPFISSGKLQQHTGRIHREYEGKNQGIVYDNVDIKIGNLSHQFQIRLNQYKKENYNVIDENDEPELLYDYSNYINQLYEDISNASNVKLLFNYHKKEKLYKLLDLIDSIEIITDEEVDSNVKKLNEHSPVNAIIINDRIIWYGSNNPFAYSKKDDTIIRNVDEEYAKDIIKFR